PELHFVTHIPQTIPGEQLVAQLFRCIPENSWLFKYGRVPMSFILADWVWWRISALPKGTERCKLSVIAKASSRFSPSLPPEDLSPFFEHFHPATNSVDARVVIRRLLFDVIYFFPFIVLTRFYSAHHYTLARTVILEPTTVAVEATGPRAPGHVCLQPQQRQGAAASPELSVNPITAQVFCSLKFP
ncbi:hypothetical protein EDB85DRAFT_1873067, partial [Lactarius pseudohatsudake]